MSLVSVNRPFRERTSFVKDNVSKSSRKIGLLVRPKIKF